jgi:hypothetical protein
MVHQPMLELLAYLRANGLKTAGPGARFALLVHHDDAKRELAYDRTDKLQKLDQAWNEAVARGWTVVSMQDN